MGFVDHDEIVFGLKYEFVLGKPESLAAPEALAEMERAVGHPMPPLLKRVYLELGDGPVFDDKLLSIAERTFCRHGVHAEPLLKEFEHWSQVARSMSGTRPFLAPLAGGCGKWTLVDYALPDGPLWSWNGQDLVAENLTLAQWLAELPTPALPVHDPWLDTSHHRDPLLPEGAHSATPRHLDGSSRPPHIPPVALTDDDVIARIRAYHRGRRLPPPASPAAVAAAEAQVGHPMPTLLKRIYLEVANGQFDDRASALPLTDTGFRSNGFNDFGRIPSTVADAHPAGPHGSVPATVVPLRFWGCSVWTHVDWSTPEGRIWGEDEGYIFPEKFTLAERLTRWMDGYEDSPQPLHARGRPIEFDDEEYIGGIHDDKTWKIVKSRHDRVAVAIFATIVGPLPGSIGTGRTDVVITHQPQKDWWWMDLDSSHTTD